jgi:tRNA-2-methylthio-N6-dimethylallyladenosine synthase
MAEKRLCYIKTFGCQMNEYDTEKMLGVLKSCDYHPTDNFLEADLILLNTCSIREKVEQKVYSTLGRLKRLKEKNPSLIIGVGGCMAQQEAEKLLQKVPYINMVFGTQSITRLSELVKAVEEKRNKVVDTSLNGFHSLSLIPRLPQRVKAYVSIMQGCNNYCAYCVVPYVRGKERSRCKEEILQEISFLAESGVKEVTLLGQNVNSYGKDLNERDDFSSLLSLINEVNGIERIRFITSHPKDLSPQLIHCFKELKKLCEHIHLPVQSGSSLVLKRMDRHYTQEEYLDKINKLRGVSPEIGITSDVIVGFPGETEEEFEETLSLLEKVEFDDLFSFKYSDRPQVKASTLPDKVDEKIKAERLWHLQNFQKKYTLMKNKRREGKEEEVLVEGVSKRDPKKLTGRTRSNKVVNFEGKIELQGSLVLVSIKRAFLHSLEGELIDPLH